MQHPVPTFGDWDMLPQLHAFMLEALRWRPVAPVGMCLSRIEATPELNIYLYARLCTPCDEGYYLGMSSCSSFRSRGSSDDRDATEGSVHPCWGDCLRMSLVRPSCRAVHSSLTVRPTGRSRGTRWCFQIQRRSTLNVGSQKTHASGRTCISTRTVLAEGTSRSNCSLIPDSHR